MLASFAVSLLAVPMPMATNVTKCLQEHCTSQVEACTKDAKCNAGINCVIACPAPVTKTCCQACIDKDLDQAMLEIGICAEGAGCLAATGWTYMTGAEAKCHAIADESSCNSGGCSWCKSAAVPSACKTKDEAKALPPSVFQCAL